MLDDIEIAKYFITNNDNKIKYNDNNRQLTYLLSSCNLKKPTKS